MDSDTQLHQGLPEFAWWLEAWHAKLEGLAHGTMAKPLVPKWGPWGLKHKLIEACQSLHCGQGPGLSLPCGLAHGPMANFSGHIQGQRNSKHEPSKACQIVLGDWRPGSPKSLA